MMADEQQHESPTSGASSHTSSAEDPTIIQSLIFPRYVVAEVYQRIERKLGLEGLRSDKDIAWAVQRCLPVRSIEALILHGMSEKEIHRLILSRRSLTAHRERHEPLTCEESDRAMRIVRLTSLAEWVFGNDVTAGRWLRHPFRLDRLHTPLDFLQTEAGAWLIEAELVGIAEGICV
jgi:putative toxin-antitoxin system antitoxin component (TIGR02293 family)